MHTKSEDTKNVGKNKWMISLFIITALLLGFFSPKLFGDAGKDISMSMSKSQLVNFLSFANDNDVTELDIEFSGVKAKVINKESSNTPKTYEVTGNFTYEQTKYTFSHEVNLYDGIYFFYELPDFEEI